MKEKKKKRSRICELKTLFTGGCGGTDQGKVSTTSFSGESGCCTGFAYSRSKPKMVEVSNPRGNRKERGERRERERERRGLSCGG